MKTFLLKKYNKTTFTFLAALFIFGGIGKVYAQGPNNSLTFDGTDDIVAVASNAGDELNPDDSITVESWLYLNETPSATHRPHFISKTAVYALVIETDGRPSFYVHNGTNWKNATGTTGISDLKWYHIAGTYDGDSIRIYLNGKLANTPVEHIGPMVKNSNDLRIGDRLGGIEVLNGSLDETRIWAVSRSELEIQESMNSILTGDEADLAGYWRFDETTGTTAADSSPNENDGTLTGMAPETAWSTSTAPFGDASIFSISADIDETPDCEVDVTFGTGDTGPGDGFSLSAIQVNSPPNDNTGLTNIADTYWEIWSENSLFDGTYDAAINFHYDNIGGIDDETQLELYRRDSATSSPWVKVNGYTIVSDDGGTSSTTDGIGYVQIAISQDTIGGFSGQYILSGSNTLDVIEFTENLNIKLYPNPSNGSFSIEMNSEETQDIEFQILSINGKIVWNEIYRNQTGKRIYPVNIEGKANGIYILNIKTKNGQVNKRLIIQ